MAAIITVIYFVQPFCWQSDRAKCLPLLPFVPEIETSYLVYLVSPRSQRLLDTYLTRHIETAIK